MLEFTRVATVTSKITNNFYDIDITKCNYNDLLHYNRVNKNTKRIYRLNGIIYRHDTPEFKEAFNKEKVWKHLKQ